MAQLAAQLICNQQVGGSSPSTGSIVVNTKLRDKGEEKIMYDVSKYKCYAYEEKNPDGSVRGPAVVAISTYAGKNVKGYAKTHPGDEFNWEKGRDLAIARCNAKIAEKRHNRACSKVAEAQKQLESAMKYLSDMTRYASDSAEELATAKANVAKMMDNM